MFARFKAPTLEAEGMDELFLPLLMLAQPNFIGQIFQQVSAGSTR